MRPALGAVVGCVQTVGIRVQTQSVNGSSFYHNSFMHDGAASDVASTANGSAANSMHMGGNYGYGPMYHQQAFHQNFKPYNSPAEGWPGANVSHQVRG
jgi:ABC-type transport system substrate-binding protein